MMFLDFLSIVLMVLIVIGATDLALRFLRMWGK
jgi:hypothetical protein